MLAKRRAVITFGLGREAQKGGEERGERREERGEGREDDPGPKSPDWFRMWGVIIIAVDVSRVCIRVRGSYQVFNIPSPLFKPAFS